MIKMNLLLMLLPLFNVGWCEEITGEHNHVDCRSTSGSEYRGTAHTTKTGIPIKTLD